MNRNTICCTSKLTSDIPREDLITAMLTTTRSDHEVSTPEIIAEATIEKRRIAGRAEQLQPIAPLALAAGQDEEGGEHRNPHGD